MIKQSQWNKLSDRIPVLSSGSNIDKSVSLIFDEIANIVKASNGKISMKIRGKIAVELDFDGENVAVNIVDPNILRMTDQTSRNTGIFEKIKTARLVGQVLNNKGVSISILRKGKKALSLGRGATPTLSSFITGSDDIQIDSITQVAKLDRDIRKTK